MALVVVAVMLGWNGAKKIIHAVQDEELLSPSPIALVAALVSIAIEMHFRLPGNITLNDSNTHVNKIEKRLLEEFGDSTHIMLHIEPARNS